MQLFLSASEIQPTPLIICMVAILVAIIVIAILCDSQKFTFDTKSIAFAGISIAASLGLSFVKLWKMPQGGSVTLASLFPILLFSFIYGTKKGVLAGIILGLLNFIVDPYIVHPAQVILDYFAAYAATGIVGCFGKIKVLRKIPQLEFALGSIVACSFKFAAHVLSGVFAFSAYATTEVWIYSLGYNATVFVDCALAIAIGIFVLSSKPLINMILNRRSSDK